MSSWANILKKEKVEPTVRKSTKNFRRIAVDAPDTSHIETADDIFDHKYNYTVTLIEEKIQEYLDYNGYSSYLVSELKPGDLLEFSKCASSEFGYLLYKRRRKVRNLYRRSNVTYKYIDYDKESENESD